MISFIKSNLRLVIFFLLLIIIACSPVWGVKYFVTQDGTAHLYNATLMLELLKGNPLTCQLYAINPVPVPNSSAHWIMVFLLLFFAPLTVTKIIVTFTFAGFVAAIGWLRWKTVGREGMETALLIGAAMAFNWFWLMGFYNFLTGVITFTFTLGLFYCWREKMNLPRAVALSLLLILVYLSHLISFGILAGSVFILAIFVSPSHLKRNLKWTAAAFLPAIPLVLSYKSLSEEGGFYPSWLSLDNPYSILSWIMQIKAADPFIIISRKFLPFSTAANSLFAIFTPALWLFMALLALSIATWFSNRKEEILSRKYLPFIILLFFTFLFVVFAPDDFGSQNGWIFRERVLLGGLVFFIPLFRANSSLWQRIAQFCLVFIIVFQTLAVWDYATQTNKIVPEYLAAREAIKDDDSIGSIFLLEDVFRFHSLPVRDLNTLNGIGRNTVVWDNYEIGYYLFPIIAQNELDRKFVRDFVTSNGFQMNNPKEDFDKKLAILDSALEQNHDKIKTMLVWGSDPRITAVLNKWYEAEPFFVNGRMHLFHHK